ncbi:MAG: hypothetical protein ABI895_12830 [Deltaproteobacteria bacterium]
MRHGVGAAACLGMLWLLGACGAPVAGMEGAGPAGGRAVQADVDGNAQKGPFSSGTRVSIAELDANLVQTGRSFATTMSDDRGSFSIRGVQLGTPYARVEVSGFYFDEVRGRLSDSPLSIFSYVDLSDRSTSNVNLLGHLEAARLEYLVTEEQVSFAEAKSRAHTEVLEIFALDSGAIAAAETLDISQPGEGNAALLAISVILQGNRPVSELSQLLSNIQSDLRGDGTLDVAANGSALLEGALGVNMDQVRTNLAQRFEAVGMDASVPDAGEQLDKFADAGKYVPPEAVGGNAAAASGGTAGAGSAGTPGAGNAGDPGYIDPKTPLPGGGGAGGASGGASGDPKYPGGEQERCTIDTCPCVPVWNGDFDFTGPEALAALSCVTEINGSLLFHQTCGIDSLVLPALTRIHGELSFHQTGFTSVSFPSLTAVGSFLYFHQNSALTSASLPVLSSVGQYTYFHGNCSLISVNLDALATVGPAAPSEQSYLYFNGNAELGSLSLPQLSSVGGYLYVAQNCSLDELAMPNLTSVNGDYVYVQSNTVLGSGPVGTLNAKLMEINFAGERNLAAGGACNALEGACGEPSCGAN